MHPYRTNMRASAADWRRIAIAAIRAHEPIDQYAARLLTPAANAGLTWQQAIRAASRLTPTP